MQQTALTWENSIDHSLMRVIPAGDFIMGSTSDQVAFAHSLDPDSDLFPLVDETPAFVGQLPAYSISIYAIDNRQFTQFLNVAHPTSFQRDLWIPNLEHILSSDPGEHATTYIVEPGFERHPATHVSWYGAKAYCAWAELRLPTEPEWEKAARGEDGRVFPWGNEWAPQKLWWWGSHSPNMGTSPVDTLPEGASPYGLLQMAGNIEEWCEDWYQPRIYHRYAEGKLELPHSGNGRVLRGGNCFRRHKLEVRCAMRRANPAAYANILYTGFRCASSYVPIQR